MKVLLYGSGAVGLGIAASVCDYGWSLDLIARGETKEIIEKNGFIRKGLFNEIHVSSKDITVYEDLNSIPSCSYDFILVCTKTTSTKEAAKELAEYRNILKPHGQIVLFQNGWGNDEFFLKYFTEDQIYSARVITGFSRPERNISFVTVHSAPILIGSLYKKNTDSIYLLGGAINKGGLPCETTTEIEKALWAKMLYNCTLNPLSAILNVAYGKLTESENSLFIMNHIIDEIFFVIDASGFKTYWQNSKEYKKDFYEKILPPTYGHRSSTLQDIERKIKTEIDSLTGSIVKLGERHNVPVPYNTMIFNLIKAKENCF